jgi:gliding motility-associated-like protein
MTTASDFTVSASGLYWVKVTNSFNCSATDSFIVRTMLPSPANFLKKTDSICSYERLEIAPAKTYNQYLWSTGSVEKRILIDKPGDYWLTVSDANGCVGTDSISVFKKECMNGVYIPTAFTPGNDGKNDVFKALVFGKVLSFKLQVFDRMGHLVFQTTDPRKGWDGLSRGLSYSTSVFVWQCFYQLDQQEPTHQKGTVTIVR